MQSRIEIDHEAHRKVGALVVLPTVLKKNAKIFYTNALVLSSTFGTSQYTFAILHAMQRYLSELIFYLTCCVFTLRN